MTNTSESFITWNAGRAFNTWKRFIVVRYASETAPKRTPYFLFVSLFPSVFCLSCMFYNYDDHVEFHIFTFMSSSFTGSFSETHDLVQTCILTLFQAFLASTPELVCITVTLLAAFKYSPCCHNDCHTVSFFFFGCILKVSKELTIRSFLLLLFLFLFCFVLFFFSPFF